jgi:hypothetical protein
MLLKKIVPLLMLVAASPVLAADLKITVEVPRLNVAEYHNPYMAIWVERDDATIAANLATWYDGKLKNEEGKKWLKDMRLWWRRGGRAMTMPVDGVSGATRSPSTYTLSFSSGKAPLGDLAAGSYKLMIEAAREVGGREVTEIPFQWPPKTLEKLSAKGNSEIGAVTVEIKP